MIMIKKIILTMIIGCFIISCGKKSDPKYTSFEKNIKKQNTLSNKT